MSPGANPGAARAARRNAGECLRCGKRAAKPRRFTEAFLRRLAQGDGTDFEYSLVLKQDWNRGDPIPPYERLAFGPWCAECQAIRDQEAEERRRERSRREQERARRRERYYRQVADGKCQSCGKPRDRESTSRTIATRCSRCHDEMLAAKAGRRGKAK